VAHHWYPGWCFPLLFFFKECVDHMRR
jgi:hypothetical protein